MSVGLGRKKTKTVHLGSKGSFTEHPGALHEALGLSKDTRLSASQLEPKSTDSPRVRRMKASAKGFKAMHHGS